MINYNKLWEIYDADDWNCIFCVIYPISSCQELNQISNEMKKITIRKVMKSDESSKLGLVKSVIAYGIYKNMKSSQFATTL